MIMKQWYYFYNNTVVVLTFHTYAEVVFKFTFVPDNVTLNLTSVVFPISVVEYSS